MAKCILPSLFFFVCQWNLFIRVNGQSYQDLYKLHQTLFSNYSTSMRPLLNQSDIMVLSPAFELISLVELDEIRQQVTVNGLLALTWKDELLTWNPNAYNGISYIAPDSTLIWKPRLALINTMSDRDLFEDDYAPVDIIHDGTVSWYPGGLFPISCVLDLRKFPFDKHTCSIRLAPMYMNASAVTFNMTHSGVSRALFLPHGEWDVTDAYMSSVFFTPGNLISYVRIDIDLKISRKPAFFIFNVYFPVLFLCAINILSFLIPSSEGEKIGFSIAVLLSMSVYMGVVGDKLPANSEKMPYMTHYIFLLFALSVICCVDNIFIVWLHNKEEKEEKKQKRQSKLNNVSRKLKILNAFKQTRSSSDKSKISPHSSQPTNSSNEVNPGIVDLEDTFPSTPPSNHAYKPGVSKIKIKDQLRIISEQSELPIPEVQTTDADCSERNSAGMPRNRYKNMAQKVNYYSAIIFCFLSITVTLIQLILMTS